jgi:hypothetical protein
MSCDRCKNKPCEDGIPISAEFKSYCVFPVGSYWIYENQVTSERDTVTILSYESKVEPSSNNNQTCTETAILRLNSTLQGHLDFVVGTDRTSPDVWQNKLFLFASNGSGSLRFLLPDNDYMLEYDTLTINGVLHNDVFIYQSNLLGAGDPIDKEVFVKGLGVVYRQFANGDEYNLVEYQLN